MFTFSLHRIITCKLYVTILCWLINQSSVFIVIYHNEILCSYIFDRSVVLYNAHRHPNGLIFENIESDNTASSFFINSKAAGLYGSDDKLYQYCQYWRFQCIINLPNRFLKNLLDSHALISWFINLYVNLPCLSYHLVCILGTGLILSISEITSSLGSVCVCVWWKLNNFSYICLILGSTFKSSQL